MGRLRGGGKDGRGVDPGTRQVLSDITEDEWRGYYRELVLFAYARCRRWLWRTGDKENLPEGHSPDSVVREAVARLYDGSRVWNHEQYPGPSPVPFLKGVVDSLIWALLSGAEHARVSEIEHGGAGEEGEWAEQSFERLREGADIGGTAALAPDERIYFEEVEAKVRSAISDREDLVEYFELLAEGLKPAEIAGRMGADVSRVYALRKTFDRRTADIQRELFGAVAKGGRAAGDGGR